jgi:hypothetical protein
VFLSSSFQPSDTVLKVLESEVSSNETVVRLIDTATKHPLDGHSVMINQEELSTDETGTVKVGKRSVRELWFQSLAPISYYVHKVRNPKANYFAVSIFEGRDSYVFFENEVFVVVGDTLKYTFGHSNYLLRKR